VTEVRDSYFMYSIYRTNCLVTIPTRTLLNFEDVLDLTLPYRQTVLLIHEYVWIWYPSCWCMRFDWLLDCLELLFLDFALMSLTDVLITLLILITRCRGDLNFVLIEDVTLLNYDLDWIGYRW